MATTRAAVALQQNRIGALMPGQTANAVAFAVKTDDPLREILETEVVASAVWANGCG
jgi:hypothetical protein